MEELQDSCNNRTELKICDETLARVDGAAVIHSQCAWESGEDARGSKYPCFNIVWYSMLSGI